MTQISEILPYPGADLVGPLPPEVQLHTVFSAGIGANAAQADAAKALIAFLTAAEAGVVIKAKGLEPANSQLEAVIPDGSPRASYCKIQ